MRCEALDKDFFTEIRDLNAAFLDLLADPRAGAAGLEMLGLDAVSAEALAVMNASDRGRIAGVPVPLAGFRALPLPSRVSEPLPVPPDLDVHWRLAANLFAAGLLTYFWQLARHQPLAASLCVGPGQGRVRGLASLSFEDVQACARIVTPLLQVRRAFSPRLLPGLVRAARCKIQGRHAVGLELIPLGLAGLRPDKPGRRRA